MELVRQGLNVTSNLGTMFPDFLQLIFRSLWRITRHALGLVNLHRQQRQSLADVVMQIPCDAASLLLLCFDHLPAHLFKCMLSQLLVGSINRRADESGK